jgi:hypothetical protein
MVSPSLKAAPRSPSLAPAAKAARPSAEGPREEGAEASEEPGALADVQIDQLHQGKVPELAHVPEAPVQKDPRALLQDVASIQPEEAYSKDEEALNTFLKLHPMLS